MDVDTRARMGAARKRSRSRSRSVSSDGGNSSDASSSEGSWNDLADDDWGRRPDYDPSRDPGAGARGGGGGAGRRQRDVTPEKITSLTPLNDTNVGMKMLRLMGWQPGGGLGARGNGRTDPIPLPVKMDGLGLGKANIETRMLDDAITKRPKVLDSQKIAEETEAQRQAREARVASKLETITAVQTTLDKFYCDICSKGYANVAQWEEHLLSYGHNHAKRKKEVAMQSRSSKNSAEEVNKRREREKRQEQKELERMAKSAGGSAGTGGMASTAFSKLAPKEGTQAAAAQPGSVTPQPEKKRGGFFKVAGAPPPETAAPPPPPPETSELPPPPPPPVDADHAPPPPPPPSAGDLPPPPPPPPEAASSAAPRFTSGSSLASTWAASRGPLTPQPESSSAPGQLPPVPTLKGPARASRWDSDSQPAGLHPLLGGPAVPPSPLQAGRSPGERPETGMLPSRDRLGAPSSSRATFASSYNTNRAPKGMAFVASSSVKQAGTGSGAQAPTAQGMSLGLGKTVRKKALDMDEGEEEDLAARNASSMPLPTGRPRAGLAAQQQQGKRIGFGFGKLG